MRPAPLSYQPPQQPKPSEFVSGLLRATRLSIALYTAAVITLSCLKLAYPMIGMPWLSVVASPAIAIGFCLSVFVVIFALLTLFHRVWTSYFDAQRYR